MATRPITATLHRKGKALSNRHYSRVSTAFPRAIQLLLIDGEPGDVIEFHSAEWGFQIGTIKLKLQGRITINWTNKGKESYK